jgi:hypothetical protein
MTYPHPSSSYQELVCTAGVLEDGSFVRLYPIDYRYRPYWEWFDKYQWIRVRAERNPKDPRPESFRPIPNVPIESLSGVVDSTKDNWAERKRFVLAKGVQTMCGLQALPQHTRSLGIIRPHTTLATIQIAFGVTLRRRHSERIPHGSIV